MYRTSKPLALAALLLLAAAPRASAQAAGPAPSPDILLAPAPAATAQPAGRGGASLLPLRPRPLSADLRPVSLLGSAPPARDPRRLPVLDEAGNPISLQEIETRVDRSGGWGLVGGALGGAIVGGLAAIVANQLVECGTAQGLFGPYDLCSPQEQALRDGLGWTAFLTGLVGGMSIGWNIDVVTWQEAVKRIRAERATVGADR